MRAPVLPKTATKNLTLRAVINHSQLNHAADKKNMPIPTNIGPNRFIITPSLAKTNYTIIIGVVFNMSKKFKEE